MSKKTSYLRYQCIWGVLFILSVCVKSTPAQEDTTFHRCYLDYEKYLSLVSKQNLAYAAEKLNVKIADAEMQAAKMFPDPYVSLDWTESREQGSRTGYGFEAEVGMSIELGGKRSARRRLAESQKTLSEILLSDYFRELRAQATLAYVDAMTKKQLYRITLDSYHAMQQLSDVIQKRYRFGSNTEIDEIQSQLESGILFHELLAAEAQWKNALQALSLMAGHHSMDSLYFPEEGLKKLERNFTCQELLQTALEKREDLLSAVQFGVVADKNIRVARAERIVDVEIKAGLGRDYLVPGARSAGEMYNMGVSIPLKFSNRYNKNLLKSGLERLQADERIKQIKLEIEVQVRQAHRWYAASLQQVKSFENGLLEKGEKVLNGKIYSFKRGETSLLEVLNAQRTFNDIQIAYYVSLGQCLYALIELEKAAGIWDIVF